LIAWILAIRLSTVPNSSPSATRPDNSIDLIAWALPARFFGFVVVESSASASIGANASLSAASAAATAFSFSL